MAVVTIDQEFTSSISAPRFFKALVVESHNLVPKLLPQSIKSIEYLEGDGAAGSIRKTTFADGSHFKYMKHKVEAMDTVNLYCKYTLFEGDMLGDKIELIVYETKFETSGDGCVGKMTSHYHAKAGVELKEEEIKAGKEQAMGIIKVLEGYLVANPDACA